MAGPYSITGNYDQVNAGNAYAGYLATAAAIPISSTTAPTACLWNRAGSNVKLVLERASFGWVGTTEAPGNILMNVLLATGSAPGTALPLTAFTAGVLNTTIFNRKLGSGNIPLGSFGTAATLTTAGVPFMTYGMSHLTTTGASTAVPGWTNDYFFYDTIIVMPGTLVYPTASAATATTYNITLYWREYSVND